jgi:hypothetical protein
MAEWYARGKKLKKSVKGQGLVDTGGRPGEGDKVHRGRVTFQIRNGQEVPVGCCPGVGHTDRTRQTAEGGGMSRNRLG